MESVGSDTIASIVWMIVVIVVGALAIYGNWQRVH